MAIFHWGAVLSPAIVAANTTAEQTFTTDAGPGSLKTDMQISVSKPTAQAGLGIVNVRVVSTTQVAITFVNDTAAGITPTASEMYQFAGIT